MTAAAIFIEDVNLTLLSQMVRLAADHLSLAAMGTSLTKKVA